MGKHAQTTVTTPAVQYGAEGSVLRSLPTSPSAAEGILKEAVWWIDAAHSSANQQIVENLGWGGSVLNTTCGSTQSADSNDPKYLDWDGENYIYSTGVNGNFLQVPYAANLDITGDIDVRAKIAPESFTSSVIQVLLSRELFGQTSTFGFSIRPEGTLGFYLYTAGGDLLIVSTVTLAAIGLIAGQTIWVRGTLDVDNGASQYAAEFFTSLDGIVWTKLGATVTGSGPIQLTSSTRDLTMCRASTSSTTNLFAGKFFRGILKNGIDGVTVADVDTSVITSGSQTSFRARTGQTVTINRSTSGRKAVAVTNPLWLFGTDDYMEVQSRWLEHTGTNYVYVPGVTGNYMAVPDAAALDITGNIDVRARVALDDWTPGTIQTLISKWENVQKSYLFRIETNGSIRLYWSNDGSTELFSTSNVPGIADGAIKWVRATLDVDNDAGGHDVQFFTSDDGTNWTQLGTTITTAGTTNIFSSTSDVLVGGFLKASGSNPLIGKVFSAQVLNGINGTKVLDIDTSVVTESSTSFTAVTGQTVTINRSGTTFQTAPIVRSGYLVAGPTYTFRPSTYSLLDFGASDSMSVFAVLKQQPNAGSNSRVLSKKGQNFSSDAGYSLHWDATATVKARSIVSDNPNLTVVDNPNSTIGTTSVIGFVIDRASRTITTYAEGIGSTIRYSSLNSISNMLNLFVGRDSAIAGGWGEFEFVAGAIFRRALTTTEISEISRYYQERIK